MRCAALVEALENRTLLAAVPVVYGAVPMVSGSAVIDSLVRIANHDTSPSLKDGTAYSYMYEGGETARSFIIRNAGNQSMTITAPTISGPGAAAFSLKTPPASLTIAPGASQRFVVGFAPTAAGSYSATITVHKEAAPGSAASNYTFAINGTCLTTQVLDGGLRVATIREGTGAAAADDTVLRMSYTGSRRADGLVFDSSLNAGRRPFTFDLGAGSVIQGWDKGLLGAKTGEQRVLFIPWALAYGEDDSKVAIPPETDLVFTTQVLGMAQNFRSEISTSGSGHVIASGDASWTHSDGTAFYSSPVSGIPKYPVVIHTFIVDLGSSIVLDAIQGGLRGTNSGSFAFAKTRNLGDGRLSVSIAYVPGTSYAPAAAGSAKDAEFWFGVGYPAHAEYHFSLHGEALVAGTKLTGTSLSITGTANADILNLTQTGQSLTVTNNGVANHFNAGDLSRINIKGAAGNDTVSAATVTVNMRVDAGLGNDIITTGSGNDVILAGSGDDQITAGAGNDLLSGSTGNDTLTGGLGNDALVGGLGTNTFYGVDDAVANIDVLDARGSLTNVGLWDGGVDIIRGLLTGLPPV